MATTMSNNIYRESKVIGIIALSLCLSACGSGFRGQATQQLATSSESSGAFVLNTDSSDLFDQIKLEKKDFVIQSMEGSLAGSKLRITV